MFITPSSFDEPCKKGGGGGGGGARERGKHSAYGRFQLIFFEVGSKILSDKLLPDMSRPNTYHIYCFLYIVFATFPAKYETLKHKDNTAYCYLPPV